MNINNYMLISLNRVSKKHGYTVTEITNIDNLSNFYFKKNGIKKHLLLRNVLILKSLESYREVIGNTCENKGDRYGF